MNSPGALNGIRVLEFARAAPGELVGRLLADAGADVIRVEAPDPSGADDYEARRRAAFSVTNRNKRAMALNLKDPRGRDAFLALAGTADVVLESFRPGVMDRLGVGYQTLAARNERLVYCAMSGFGQDGPDAGKAGHDITYLAAAGILGLFGAPGGDPAIPLNFVADFGGAAMHAAVGILLALLARERTRAGQRVDVTYLDTSFSLLAATPNMSRAFSDDHLPTQGEGVLGGSYPFYTTYETRDHRYLAVGCTEPHLWQNFCDAIARPELGACFRRWEQHYRHANDEERAVRDEIAELIRTKDLGEWEALLDGADVGVSAVRTVREALEDKQLQHLDAVVELDHPEFGPIRQTGLPIRLSKTPGSLRVPAPRHGEHTGQILAEIGLSGDEIDRLVADGVVR